MTAVRQLPSTRRTRQWLKSHAVIVTDRTGGVIMMWRWLTGLGIALAIVGVVDLIWIQADFPGAPYTDNATFRWQSATAPLMLVALGLVVVGAGQILRAVEDRGD
jgi:hypothetical protein